MNNDLKIRPYTVSDYQQVKAIYQSKGAWFTEGTDDEDRLAAKIEKDPGSILVAEKEGNIIGTVSIIEDGRMAFIVRLAVAEEERQKGIGTLLLQEAEKALKERGLKKVNILVSEVEDYLYPYYEKRGYSRGTKHLWMWKELK